MTAFSGKGQVVKALIMTVFGLMLTTVGPGRVTGVERFTLWFYRFTGSFLLLAMATFATNLPFRF